jgi:DNA invertase Pin-like site-specific DNA recombinase
MGGKKVGGKKVGGKKVGGKKVGRPPNPNTASAVAEVLKGEKVKDVAMKYGIHPSTLYAKVRKARMAGE